MSEPTHATISEADIERLVRAFYARVRVDPLLEPVFSRAIPGDWESHLRRMCDFWSAVLLKSGRYRGNPMAVHQRLPGLAPAYFGRWLSLFRLTANETLAPRQVAQVMERAERIAESLQRGLFYNPAGMAMRDAPSGAARQTDHPQ